MGKEYTLDILVFCFRMLVRIYHVCKSFPFFLLANQRTYILLSVICAIKCISHLFYPSHSLSLPFSHYLPSPSVSAPRHSGQILDNKVQRKWHSLKTEFKWHVGSSNIPSKYVVQREFWCKCENTISTAKWCLFLRNACKPELVYWEHCSYLLPFSQIFC